MYRAHTQRREIGVRLYDFRTGISHRAPIRLPVGICLVDLRVHRLKGLPTPSTRQMRDKFRNQWEVWTGPCISQELQ